MINVPHFNLMDKICLSSYIYDRIERPIETLKSFFEYKDFPLHLKYLKEWRKMVETYAYFEINTFSSPLFDHKMICNLINAAYLLIHEPELQNSTLNNLSSSAQERYLNHECLNGGYVKHLSTEELIDPHLAINLIFTEFPVEFYHQHLYEWLTVSMSPNVVVGDKNASAKIYQNLRRLIEACWLICKRVSKDLMIENAENLNATPDPKETENAIAEETLRSFLHFLEVVPANRLNRGLRKMLIDYLFYNMDGLPNDFEETLGDFYWLTEFLDEIQGKAVDPKFL